MTSATLAPHEARPANAPADARVDELAAYLLRTTSRADVLLPSMSGPLGYAHSKVSHFGVNTGRTVDLTDEGAWLPGFVCGWCGERQTAPVVAAITDGNYRPIGWWVRCLGCGEPSVRNMSGVTSPSPLAGEDVEGLSAETAAAYTEARRCAGVGAFTACELMCRKLLMHVAVDKGAKEGATFASYLDHLATEGYITPPMRPWTAKIKDNGNQSTHELPPVDEARAVDTLAFTTQLLRLVYEMDFKRVGG